MKYMNKKDIALNGLVLCLLAALTFFLARYLILPGEVEWNEIPLDFRIYAFLASTGFVVAVMSILALVLALDAWIRSRRLFDPVSAKRAGRSVLVFAVGVFLVWLFWNWFSKEANKHEQPQAHAQVIGYKAQGPLEAGLVHHVT